MDGKLYLRVRGRVLGPYDDQKLKSLAKRGQLSRMHEVSEDSVNWTRASSYPELFVSGRADSSAGGRQPGVPQPSQEMAVRPPPGAPQVDQEQVTPAPASEAAAQAQSEQQWHYGKSDALIGPVDYTTLQQMIEMGQLGADTPVWTDGMAEWVAARQVPGLVKPPVVRQLNGSASDGSAEDRSSDEDSLSLSLCRAAIGSRPWAQFIAIVAFVYAGLSVAGGIGLLISGANNGLPPVVASGLFSLIYAAISFTGGVLLTGYGRHLGRLDSNKSPIFLEKALDTLRGFWIFLSIILIVMLAFIIFIGVWIAAISGSLPDF